MAVYKKLAEVLAAGREAALITVIDSEKEDAVVGQRMVISPDGILYSELDNQTTAKAHELALPSLGSGRGIIAEMTLQQDKKMLLFIHSYIAPPRLIILGGGHVGGALCRIAAHLDFEIILIDDRPSFASSVNHPDAHQLICDQFDRALDRLEPSLSDYIVIVTRGHRHDRLCLEKALARKAAYLGMIGSKRRVRAQLEELATFGYSLKKLNAVHSPIGLSIGAVTEAEIAVSIMAEIIKVRRSAGGEEPFQMDILQELVSLEQDQSRVVLATVINTLGSTPRKTGAQMLVCPDGTLKGTIGGGCSEAEVKIEALKCLDRGRPCQFRLRLTAEAAAEEGMACGAIMDVFLQPLPSPPSNVL